MKKILIALLFISTLAHGQMPATGGSSICLAPVCQPYKCLTTDTVVLAYGLTTSDGFKGIAYKQVSGPSAAVFGPTATAWASGLAATSTAKVWGFQPGTYTFQAIGTSASGGITAPAVDSVIVSAPPVIVPPVKFIVASFQLMDGKRFTLYSDGSYLLQ